MEKPRVPNRTQNIKLIMIEILIKENGVSSLSTPSSQTAVQASQGVIVSQTGLMMNYINKEPFNEEVEIEETSLYGPGCEWRELVFENFRKLIDDLKQFQNNPGLDVTTI